MIGPVPAFKAVFFLFFSKGDPSRVLFSPVIPSPGRPAGGLGFFISKAGFFTEEADAFTVTVGTSVMTVGTSMMTVGTSVMTVGTFVVTVGTFVVTVGTSVVTVGTFMVFFGTSVVTVGTSVMTVGIFMVNRGNPAPLKIQENMPGQKTGKKFLQRGRRGLRKTLLMRRGAGIFLGKNKKALKSVDKVFKTIVYYQ